MSGLLRRIRRPGAAEETRTEATTTPTPAHGSAPAAPATGEDGQRLPAGIAPEDLERRGATGRRSRLRRRARFLRRARELALRDLGGLVYEARRREQDGGKLIEDKVARIEATLGVARGETVIREPGVGGTCARCGELHGSDARFCSHCGANLEEAAAEAAEKARAEEAARAEAEKAEAEKAAAEKAEAEKAEAEKAEPAAEESPDGTGNGRPVTKAADAPTTEQPATDAADAPDVKAAPDEPATKPLA
jgi:hypothetical protein